MGSPDFSNTNNQMKDKYITEINVDDYIREQKRKGKKIIYWGLNGRKMLRKFAKIIFHDSQYRLPHSFPNNDVFMGIRHQSKTNH